MVSNTLAFLVSGLPKIITESSTLRSLDSISVWLSSNVWVILVSLVSFSSPAWVVMMLLAILVIVVR